jgi:hypothetical protein
VAIDLKRVQLTSEAQRILVVAGVGQRQLARAAGSSPATSRAWLTGQSKPGQTKRHAIAKEFPDCSPGLWDQPPFSVREEAPAAPAAPAAPESRSQLIPKPSRLDNNEYPPGSAKRLAREQLDRIQEWRAEAEADRNFDLLIKLGPLESKAIGELARYSGELSPADEDRLSRTSQFAAATKALLDVLRPFPEACAAAGEALREFSRKQRGVS